VLKGPQDGAHGLTLTIASPLGCQRMSFISNEDKRTMGTLDASSSFTRTIMGSQEDKFIGTCGACGEAVYSTSKSNTLARQHGSKCDRHDLMSCLACCITSEVLVLCGNCATESFEGSSDPFSQSSSRYASRALESEIGTNISYIHYSGCSRGRDLIEQIQLWSPYEAVSDLPSNPNDRLRASCFSGRSNVLLRS
jgi:hypothetical protein